MKNYFSDDMVVERLITEYTQHKNLIIGFDFDNTIFDSRLIGIDCSEVWDLLRECSDLGFTMCLWTIVNDSPSSESMPLTLEQKIEICKNLGIRVDYVNDSPIHLNSSGTGKQFFSILLDDRAGLSSAIVCLRLVIVYIRMKNFKDAHSG